MFNIKEKFKYWNKMSYIKILIIKEKEYFY